MTQLSETDPAVTWQVIGQSQTSDLDQSGRAVTGMSVQFRTGDGHVGSVFVPLTAFSPASVANAINPAAATLDAVGRLTSDG